MKQRKKTPPSCVESLMGKFALRDDFKSDTSYESEVKANQEVTLTMCQFLRLAGLSTSRVNLVVSGRQIARTR